MLELDKVYHKDALEGMKLIDDESINLVYSDPPYLKEYLYTYDYLANECPRIMKRGLV